MLNIQTNLITLYSNNLSAIATQAALVAGFAFTAVTGDTDTGTIAKLVLSYFYYVLFTVCFVTALFILSQATIVVMFGPTMALKGSTDEAVKYAAAHMMSQQLVILKAALICYSSLFIAACILSWASYPYGIAAICTVVYAVAYYYLIKQGFRAYRIFVPDDDSAFVEPLLELSNSGSTPSVYKAVGTSESKDDRAVSSAASLAAAQEVKTAAATVVVIDLLLPIPSHADNLAYVFLIGDEAEGSRCVMEEAVDRGWRTVRQVLCSPGEGKVGLLSPRERLSRECQSHQQQAY